MTESRSPQSPAHGRDSGLLERMLADLPGIDSRAQHAVADRAAQVLRPAGAFARLDGVAAWLADWQRNAHPRIERPTVLVFAADHGVAAEGVSAYPSDITAAMVEAVEAGVATVTAMSLRFAWAFLTRLPGGATPRSDRDLHRSVPWFPLVGAVIGCLSGALYWASLGVLRPPLAATAAVAMAIVLTGALHEDGLADTADSFGGSTRQRRLEIMKDPHLGAFGTLALVLSTVAQILAITPLGARDGWIVLILAHGAGRMCAVLVMLSAPSRNDAGLGHSYTQNLKPAPSAIAVLATFAVAAALGPAGSAAVGAAGLAAFGVGVSARRRLGGTTGDVLGAGAHIGQVIALIAAARLVGTHGWTWG